MKKIISEIDNPLRFINLDVKVKVKILNWINEKIEYNNKPSHQTSYTLKHIFEYDTKIYLDNGEFKGAMLFCGHYPISRANSYDKNWIYNIYNVKTDIHGKTIEGKPCP